MTHTDDADRAALVGLVALPELGPARLRALLTAFGPPAAAWDAVTSSRLDGVDLRRNGDGRRALIDGWRAAARAHPGDAVLEAHRRAGVRVLIAGDPDWPPTLVDDPEPPSVLFAIGDVTLLAAPSVAVVGTRRCTAAGRALARSLGRELAEAGVSVVSGLALGIDGASHRGHLDGGGSPVGVVATGLDHVYPSRHRDLWRDVGERGVLVSEAPLGVAPDRWRFPARNRLIAAFALAVVVVETRCRGGSMSTVDAAADRGIEVLAVPGSPLSAASSGTNQLLHEGCGVVRDAADVLAVLGTSVPVGGVGRTGPEGTAPMVAGAARPSGSDPVAAEVLAALSPHVTAVETLAASLELPVTVLTSTLARLEATGVIRRVGAGYRLAVDR